MKITFGMIVWNGALFLEQVLRNIYDTAHKIVVVEGAVSAHLDQAGPAGRSTDRTLEILESFPDPDDKLTVISGTWPEKDQQCNEYMLKAEGDYVWQVDCDELYLEEDMEQIVRMLRDSPRITSVSFKCHTFFKNLHTVARGGIRWEFPFERIHRFHPGWVYTTHRPPTIIHPEVERPLRDICPVTAEQTEDMGIRLYHYSYVTRDQVGQKLPYYLDKPWGFDPDYMTRVWDSWDEDREGVEGRFGVHPDQSLENLPNGTVPFLGRHPEAMFGHPLLQREALHP